ncbi:MAG: histidine kinase [Acidobacteriota bacterium]|nr:histidine kinase [Acidobacteriota bacterium]
MRDITKLRRRARTGLVVFGAWTVSGLYAVVESHYRSLFFQKPISWSSAFRYEMAYVWWGALFTPAVLWFSRRYPLERRHWARNGAMHLLGMSLFAIIMMLCWTLVSGAPAGYVSFGEFSFPKLLRSLSSGFDYGVAMYLLVILVYHALVYHGRYQKSRVESAELEAQLANAQVQALRMQLHPHFLFNTLNSISALVQEDPEAAETMIARLSELLRMSLDSSLAQEIPLSRELEFLNLYLDLERTRYEDRLTVEFDVDAAAREALVPNMILQAIVENAIRHGISQRPAGGRISISARRRAGDLLLRVEDNGAGQPLHGWNGFREGVGLRTTRGRLEKMYGNRQRLELEPLASGGVAVRIALPFMAVGTHAAD